MRLLFVHDHRFVRGSDGRVYSGSFPAATWERYLRHFDELVIVSRDGGQAAPDTQLARADENNVRFNLVPGLESAMELLRGNALLDATLDKELEKADALVVMLPSRLALRAVQKAQAKNIPFAAEVVGCAWDSYFNHGHPAARAYAPIAFMQQRGVLKDAPLALYVTKQFLQKRYPTSGYTNYASNVEIVPMGEDGHRSRAERLRQIAAGRPPQFGTVGSLRVKYKGYQIAIPAIGRLRREGLDVHYSILGPGDPAPYQALAEQHGVADLIVFAGVRPAVTGVGEWLDGIDIHLQPSFQEGLPRATVEAMSRGAACMGSTCGGLPEILSPDRTHTPGDVATLASQIKAMALDPDRIEATSRTDLKTAEDFFPDVLQARRDEVFSRLRGLAERRSVRSVKGSRRPQAA